MTGSFAGHMALPHSWFAVRAQLDAGSRQLSECARAEDRIDWEDQHPDVVADYEAECNYLGTLIKDAHLKMLLLIDQLGAPSFLAAYRKGFRKYRGKLTEVVRIEFDPEIRESEALRYVRSAFNTLSDSMEPRRRAHEVDAIAQVERLLRSTHYIVARAGVEPKAESDVEVALFDYLRILYPTARRQVPISHVIKTFKVDIGIDELGVLIEVKFVDCAREVKSECPSLYEDMFGYRGDPKWTTHFALVYSTGPDIKQEELEAEFAIADCPVDWKPIAVWGKGGRPERAHPLSGGETRPMRAKRARDPSSPAKSRKRLAPVPVDAR